LTDEQRKRAAELLRQNAAVFAKDDTDLGYNDWLPMHIDTGTHRPLKQPVRKQPYCHQPEIEANVKKLLQTGAIEPACSPWSSNVLLVRKKDGTYQFCVDYRKLNELTEKDSYPLPRIDQCLDSLGGATLFSCLDLQAGYWQAALDPTDAAKTAFTVRSGSYQFKVLSMGLANAPSQFQRLMNLVLSGLLWEACLVYLDDVIIYSATFEQHLERLAAVLHRFRCANLKLKPRKCQLFCEQVHFLGHVISAAGVLPDPSKVDTIQQWPATTNVSEVRSFLGLASYYRRFIPQFADIARPLHTLTAKESVFIWKEEQEIAFRALQSALLSAPVLASPVDDGKYYLDTDASFTGLGAVLQQEQEGQIKVIAYASRVLSPAERNYCTTRRELLALVFGLKQFRQFFLGRRFVLRVDHSALVYLRRTPEVNGQAARWLDSIDELDFEMLHRPGAAHGNCDALSRRPCEQVEGRNACRQCRTKLGISEEQEETMLSVFRGAERCRSPVHYGSLDCTRPCQPMSQPTSADGCLPICQPMSTDDHQPMRQPTSSECYQPTRNQQASKTRRSSHQGNVYAITKDTNCSENSQRSTEVLDLERISAAQRMDPDVGAVLRRLQHRSTAEANLGEPLTRESSLLWEQRESLMIDHGVLYRRMEVSGRRQPVLQVIMPKELRREFLQQMHQAVWGVHLGIWKMQLMLRERAYWPGWRTVVERYCKECTTCRSAQRGPTRRQGLMQTYPFAGPYERLHIDLTGKHPVSRSGHKYILTVIDAYTRFLITAPLKDKTAVAVANALVERVFCPFGSCREIVSDQGSEFCNALMSELCERMHVVRLRTTVYRPQANGVVERVHRSMNTLLSKVVSENQRDWPEWLPAITAAYNASYHESTGFSPYYLVYGREYSVPIDLTLPLSSVEGPTMYVDYTEKYVSRMREAFRIVNQMTGTTVQRSKQKYDRRVSAIQFNPGDFAWYYCPRRKANRNQKWRRLCSVCLVEARVNEVNYRIRTGPRSKPFVAHIDRLQKFIGELPLQMERWAVETLRVRPTTTVTVEERPAQRGSSEETAASTDAPAGITNSVGSTDTSTDALPETTDMIRSTNRPTEPAEVEVSATSPGRPCCRPARARRLPARFRRVFEVHSDFTRDTERNSYGSLNMNSVETVEPCVKRQRQRKKPPPEG